MISSVDGSLARPGSAAAAKWAVGGFTEALSEPGGMRTNWGARANKEHPRQRAQLAFQAKTAEAVVRKAIDTGL